ncbi:MAG TPA: hypothetical protein VF540_00385, partial [Segetibacter sp.]
LLSEFNDSSGIVRSVVYSQDGRQILTVSDDDVVRLWNTNGGLIKKYEGYRTSGEESYYKRRVQSAAFTSEGIKILTSLDDGHRGVHKVKLWSAEGSLLRDLKWPDGNFASVRLSPDGTKILAAFYDFGLQKNAALLWDTSGAVLKEYTGDRDDFSYLAFSSDGSKIYSGSQTGNLKLWRTILPLEEFLKSGQIDELTPAQKKEFGIK